MLTCGAGYARYRQSLITHATHEDTSASAFFLFFFGDLSGSSAVTGGSKHHIPRVHSILFCTYVPGEVFGCSRLQYLITPMRFLFACSFSFLITFPAASVLGGAIDGLARVH